MTAGSAAKQEAKQTEMRSGEAAERVAPILKKTSQVRGLDFLVWGRRIPVCPNGAPEQ